MIASLLIQDNYSLVPCLFLFVLIFTLIVLPFQENLRLETDASFPHKTNRVGLFQAVCFWFSELGLKLFVYVLTPVYLIDLENSG